MLLLSSVSTAEGTHTLFLTEIRLKPIEQQNKLKAEYQRKKVEECWTEMKKSQEINLHLLKTRRQTGKANERGDGGTLQAAGSDSLTCDAWM